jgi:type I restriction enzyme M protein
VKYVSDKYTGKSDAIIDIPTGSSFADMVKQKGGKEVGDKINTTIGRLADVNDRRGVA